MLDDLPTLQQQQQQTAVYDECRNCHGTGKLTALTATSVPSLPFDVNLSDNSENSLTRQAVNNGGKNVTKDRRSNSCDRLTILKDLKDGGGLTAASKTTSKSSSLLKRPSFKERFSLIGGNANNHLNADSASNHSGNSANNARKHSLINPAINISNKLAGIVGSGTKILRRHTTYIRNPRGAAVIPASSASGTSALTSGNSLTRNAGADLDAESSVASINGHVHSWHRNQVGYIYIYIWKVVWPVLMDMFTLGIGTR